MIAHWGLLVVALASTWLLTGVVRQYAMKHELYDVPNFRSSHSVATPRAGGIAVALIFMLCTIYLYGQREVSLATAIAILGSGSIVAAMGLRDDFSGVGAGWRLLSHFIASLWVLYWLGGAPAFSAMGIAIPEGWWLNCIAAIFLVWLLNLYNFMDGIDGIASVEGISVCVAAAVIHSVTVIDSTFWILPAVLGASLAGFAVWNYPKARIFLGDTGSGFVGLSLGVLMMGAAHDLPRLGWCWLVLLGVFIVDATMTLSRRLLRGEKVYVAHRSHAYQRASRKYESHRVVTNAVGVINLVWLFPWALAIALGWVDELLGLVLAYAPLLWLGARYGAGAPDD